MNKSRLAELASRQAELVSDDDISDSSSSAEPTIPIKVQAPIDEDISEDEEAQMPQHFGNNSKREKLREEEIRERLGQAQEHMHQLMQSFDEDQMKRYEIYRRVGLPRPVIKKLISRLTESSSINPNVLIVLAGVAKVFVGELVETAVDVSEDWQTRDKTSGIPLLPLRPSHIREAHRRMQERGAAPKTPPSNPFFRQH